MFLTEVHWLRLKVGFKISEGGGGGELERVFACLALAYASDCHGKGHIGRLKEKGVRNPWTQKYSPC